VSATESTVTRNDDKSAFEQAQDKATEKVCIERWHWTLVKIVALFTVVSAIAHLGEAFGEVGKLVGWW